MGYLFSAIFQGELTTEASLDSARQREIARHAFPSTPPRDAAAQQGFRAHKIAPLEGGEILLSTSTGGARDDFGRSVLQAKGCVLDASQLTGALRDLVAAWQVLEKVDLAEGFEGFWKRAHQVSFSTSPDAFQKIQAPLANHGPFHARLAEVLNDDRVDLYLGSIGGLELIRPALALLPLARIRRLHLVLGGELSEYRESVVGLAETAPSGLDHPKRGVLDNLLKRRGDISVDFANHEVYGAISDGPLGLAQAIVDPQPWPDGLLDLPRYQVLLQCIDAEQKGRGAPTPFDFRPDLAELRQSIHDLEDLSKELAQWR